MRLCAVFMFLCFMFSGLGFLKAGENIKVPCTERGWEDVKNDLRDDNIKDDWSNSIKDAGLCEIKLDSSVVDADCVIKFASVEIMSFPKYVKFRDGKYVKVAPSEVIRHENIVWNNAFKFLLKCKNSESDLKFSRTVDITALDEAHGDLVNKYKLYVCSRNNKPHTVVYSKENPC